MLLVDTAYGQYSAEEVVPEHESSVDPLNGRIKSERLIKNTCRKKANQQDSSNRRSNLYFRVVFSYVNGWCNCNYPPLNFNTSLDENGKPTEIETKLPIHTMKPFHNKTSQNLKMNLLQKDRTK